MYDKIAEIFKLYYDRKKLANQDYIMDICKIICQNDELSNYVKACIFKNNTNFPAYYDFGKEVLVFNFNKLFNPELLIGNFNEDTICALMNANILYILYHELAHVDQFRTMIEKTAPNIALFSILYLQYQNIFLEKTIPNIVRNKVQSLYYNKYWLIDPCERMANISADSKMIKTFNLIEKIVDLNDKTIIPSLNRSLWAHYITGYTINGNVTNSPSLDYLLQMPLANNKILEYTIPLIDKENLSFEARAYMGLSITKEEYTILFGKYWNAHTKTKKIK